MMIVRELWKEAARFPALLAASVGLLVLVLGTHVSQAIAIAWAMSAVVGGQAGRVWVALGVIVGIALIRLALSLAQTSVATRLGGQVRVTIRDRAMTRALTADRLHDTTARDGTLRASLGDGIDGTDAYVSKYIPVIVQVLVACPVLVIVLFVLDPWAGMSVGLGVVLALVGPLAWKRMMSRRGLDHWDSYEALSADLLESLRGMATLRILGAVPGTRERLHARSEGLRRATERVMRVSLAETGITDFAIQAGVVAAAAAAIVHAVTGHAPALEVYLILLLSAEAFRPIRELSRHWHAGFLGLTAIPGLARVGAFEPAGDEGLDAGPVSDSRRPVRSGEALRIQDLSFRYPATATPVLDNVGFTARRGALSAVVGPSGAGKSTLFDLLLGFLTPDAGVLELDGRPLLGTDVAVVSQRPVLFADTIRNNLCVSTAQSDPELVEACRAAGIWEDIASLPDGLDTEVTEAGSSLSGGQRQRLALARALLAERAVLLVDEPTSALDSRRAEAVIGTLHRVAADRIVIMISHRPETLKGVSNVLPLGGAQVAGGAS
ncbi:ATP-binding cassette domain-containing protein [Citricoccus nitrophenolicus]